MHIRQGQLLISTCPCEWSLMGAHPYKLSHIWFHLLHHISTSHRFTIILGWAGSMSRHESQWLSQCGQAIGLVVSLLATFKAQLIIKFWTFTDLCHQKSLAFYWTSCMQTLIKFSFSSYNHLSLFNPPIAHTTLLQEYVNFLLEIWVLSKNHIKLFIPSLLNHICYKYVLLHISSLHKKCCLIFSDKLSFFFLKWSLLSEWKTIRQSTDIHVTIKDSRVVFSLTYIGACTVGNAGKGKVRGYWKNL